MTAFGGKVYKQAVVLNPNEEADLIERFHKSSSPQSPELESKWKVEVARRHTAYEEGMIPADSMENVFNRLVEE